MVRVWGRELAVNEEKRGKRGLPVFNILSMK